jgi:DNA invertase Pin-like site-specific DNA recombinase
MVKAANNLHRTIGYARVSTDGQSVDSQHSQLKRAGAEKIFSEKVSGAKTDRAQLAKCLAALSPGDTLLVTRLDRLARSTRDLLNILHQLAERKVAFKSLGDPWADTTSPHGRLLVTMLGGIADFERELIRARTGEGRKRAKANGVKFGRPFVLTLHQRREALRRLDAGQTHAEIARDFNVDPTTIGRLLKRREEREGVVHHLPVPIASSLLRTMRRA